jgi:hypothetical protein
LLQPLCAVAAHVPIIVGEDAAVVAAPVPVAGGHTLLHPPRGRACNLCGGMVLERLLFVHKRMCSRSAKVVPSDELRPIGVDSIEGDGDDPSVFALVGGLPDALQAQAHSVAKSVLAFVPDMTSRPGHRGKIVPFGYSPLHRQVHVGTRDVAERLATLYENMVAPGVPIAMRFRDGMDHPEFSGRCPNAVMLPPLSVPGYPGTMNVFFGYSYSQQASSGAFHPPPPAVARCIGGLSCKDMCEQCKTLSCEVCPGCCLHRDNQDMSLTFLVGWQNVRVSVKSQAAFFILGDVAYPLRAGLTAIFNGGEISHGFWAPPVSATTVPWHSVAFVVRSVANHI